MIRNILDGSYFFPSEKLRFFLLAIFLGLFLGRSADLCPYFLFLGMLSGIVAIRHRLFWLGVGSAFLLGGAFAQYTLGRTYVWERLEPFLGAEKVISGKVVRYPESGETDTRAIFEVESLSSDRGLEWKGRARILVIVPRDKVLRYGMKLTFETALYRPPKTSTFDFMSMYRRAGVEAVARVKQFEVLDPQAGFWLLHWALVVRDWGTEILSSLPYPHSHIALGMALGIKDKMPDFVNEAFHRSSLQHLLVVSGSNVALVIFIAQSVLSRGGRWVCAVGTLGLVVFFVGMTGGDAPVLRAGIMAGLVTGGKTFGRAGSVRNIFLLTLVVMGIINPLMVQSDMGFYLSCGATYGLIVFAPFFERKLRFFPPLIREVLSLCLAAELAVFPLLCLFFPEVPVLGIVSNLYADPLVPLILFFVPFAFLDDFLGWEVYFFRLPLYFCLEMLLHGAFFFKNLPPFTPPFWLSYTLGGLILFFFGRHLLSRDKCS